MQREARGLILFSCLEDMRGTSLEVKSAQSAFLRCKLKLSEVSDTPSESPAEAVLPRCAPAQAHIKQLLPPPRRSGADTQSGMQSHQRDGTSLYLARYSPSLAVRQIFNEFVVWGEYKSKHKAYTLKKEQRNVKLLIKRVVLNSRQSFGTNFEGK